MLRLAHRILSQPVVMVGGDPRVRLDIEFAQESLPAYPVIIADNIAELMADDPNRGWSFQRDMRDLAPPFDRFFLEYELKLPAGLATDDRPSLAMSQIGWMFDVREAEAIRNASTKVSGIQEDVLRIASQDDVRWLMKSDLWYGVKGDGRAFCSGDKLITAIGSDGQIVTFLEYRSKVFEGTDQNALRDFCGTALLAIAFMNVSNSSLLEATEAEGVPAAKWTRRMRQPKLSYRTIHIRPLAEHARRPSSGSGETAAQVALHICRGFFRDYKPEGGGLFGKGIFGRFYVPSHARGSMKQGIVRSTYEVHAPAKPDKATPSATPA